MVLVWLGVLWLLRPVAQAQDVPAPSAASVDLPPAIRRKLHPDLIRLLRSASTTDRLRVQIVMREQIDLGVKRTRAALVADLQAQAARSQAGVLARLDRAVRANRAADVRPLWINNSIAAQIDRDLLGEIAARDDVALIKPDAYRQWIDPAWRSTAIANRLSPTSSPRLPTSVEWGIAKIRADMVWSALNVTGTGVVVANMDTGVDGQHPDLQESYRGYNPKGLPVHWGNWYDATGLPSQYPYDAHGHGTHTLGTIVGGNGLGVAPGAKWIGVRIFDSSGGGLDSWIHAGFQWVLAPGGDPARAPDVMNNSWGTPIGAYGEYQSDVQVLNAAGIIAIFAAGNTGPGAGTIYAPGSYPEAFSVGATDDEDVIAGFSSRGPSPFGPIKPEMVAPGVNVKSTFPGGGYAIGDGTSMATPHVAGVVALMKSAAPGLTIAEARYALTSTAQQSISATYPGNSYGWGRLDAYGAVLAVAHTGSVTGAVIRGDTDAPLGGARILAESVDGRRAETVSAADGTYHLFAGAGVYQLTFSAFGFAPEVRVNIVVMSDTVTHRDAALTPLPIGTLSGKLTDLTGTHALTGVIAIPGAPVSVTVSGSYQLELPQGAHVVQARVDGYRIVTTSVIIEAGQTTVHDFALPDAPSILLVDSGRYYLRSQIGYYRQALDDLGFPYDYWPIRDTLTEVPTTATLRAYEVVIWSSPLDSPGSIGAARALDDYLANGGKLLLSGQDIAYFDGYWDELYLTRRLLADYVADDAPTRTLTGTRQFEGQSVIIDGPGGADNQLLPDVITSVQPEFTDTAFEYAPGQSGGQTTGLCRSYRGVYLSFGFEAVTERAARTALMERALAVLQRPPQTQAYRFSPLPQMLIGKPGHVLTTSLTLHNLDEVTPATLFQLSVETPWPLAIGPDQFQMTSCSSQIINLSINVPAGVPPDTRGAITITATPIDPPGPSVSATLHVKAPASVLLIEDDVWYRTLEEPQYLAALHANGLSVDTYLVPGSWAGPEPPVPSLDQLRAYPLVIWLTGYDSYLPLSLNNELMLEQYVADGGYLLLSGQDYLTVQGPSAFARQVLGVLAAAYDLTATVASGPADSRFDGFNQLPVSLPYRNYSDALAPAPEADVLLVGQHAWPIAVGRDYGAGRAAFTTVGIEGLPPDRQAAAMRQFTGYLSRLGRSGGVFNTAVASPGERVTLLLTVANDSATDIDRAVFTVTAPAGLTPVSPGALTWQDSLPAGRRVTSTVDFTVTTSGLITVPIEWADEDRGWRFATHARLAVDRPALAFSIEPSRPIAHSREVITWQVTLRNLGLVEIAPKFSAQLPFELSAISGTLQASSGEATFLTQTIEWAGTVPAGKSISVTYQMTLPKTLTDQMLYSSAAAMLDDELWHAGGRLLNTPWRAYLPIMPRVHFHPALR